MSLPETIGSKELAALHGITVQSLGQLEARGIVRKLARNTFATVEASAAISSHYREMAAGRKSDGGEKLDLVAERARLAKEQADGAEIKNALARKEMLPVRDVENRWATILSTIRAKMLSLSSEISQLLPLLTRADLDVIDRAIRDALNGAADEIGAD